MILGDPGKLQNFHVQNFSTLSFQQQKDEVLSYKQSPVFDLELAKPPFAKLRLPTFFSLVLIQKFIQDSGWEVDRKSL